MSHTYCKIIVHAVFATHRRERCLNAEMRSRLHAYIGGIARENSTIPLAVGGVEDHVHVLILLHPTVSISEAMKKIKGGSSRWLKQSYPESAFSGWQEGYGAFSIGETQIQRAVAYIQHQEVHHREMSYSEELRRFVQRHGIVFLHDE